MKRTSTIRLFILAAMATMGTGFVAPFSVQQAARGGSLSAAPRPTAGAKAKAPTAQAPKSPAPPASSSPLEQVSAFFSSVLTNTGSSSSVGSGVNKGGKKKEVVVAISGASGMVGRALTQRLIAEGLGGSPVRVLPLVRGGKAEAGGGGVQWDPVKGSIDVTALEGADVIIHLAGENVGSGSSDSLPSLLGAWSDKKKSLILESRRSGTATIVKAITAMKTPPKVLVCASAVGYYGYNRGDTTFDETSGSGEGFLAEVARVWEAEANKATQRKGVRVVSARFGVILSKQGGLIKKLAPLFSVGGGGIIGDGQQVLSYVTLNDVVRAIKFIVETPSLFGPVNVVAPQCVSNAEFTSALGQALKRPTFVPLPTFAAEGVFGDMGKEMLTGGQKVVPSKLKAAGFTFQSPTIDSAIQDALK